MSTWKGLFGRHTDLFWRVFPATARESFVSWIWCLELQVSFRKRPTNYRALLTCFSCDGTRIARFCDPILRTALSHLGRHFRIPFQSSKMKARTSVLPRFSGKRRSSFELWALKELSKISHKLDWLYVSMDMRIYRYAYLLKRLDLFCRISALLLVSFCKRDL